MKVLRNGKAVEVPEPPTSFQTRVDEWLIACFGEEIARDPIERNHRFLEEALELVQSTGCTHSEAHQLVDYVYGRDVGEIGQEIGGVMNTLAALCLAHGFDMVNAGDTELARCWTKIEKIRAKQAAKPKHSPLPQSALPLPEPASDPRDATIARLSADMVAAREALAPFAKAAAHAEDDLDDKTLFSSSARYEVTCGDLRRARAVLAKLSKGE